MIGLLSIFKDVATVGSLTSCGYKFSMTFLAVLKAVEPETIWECVRTGTVSVHTGRVIPLLISQVCYDPRTMTGSFEIMNGYSWVVSAKRSWFWYHQEKFWISDLFLLELICRTKKSTGTFFSCLLGLLWTWLITELHIHEAVSVPLSSFSHFNQVNTCLHSPKSVLIYAYYPRVIFKTSSVTFKNDPG